MIDLFCGGATVGMNTNAKKIIFIDNSPEIINLLNFFYKNEYNFVLKRILKTIKKYNLSCSYTNGYKFYRKQISDANNNNGLKNYNSKQFYIMRNDYNNLKNKTSNNANILLYLLMIYSFNNDFRFSKDKKFNLPIGKTDFNKQNAIKLKKFIDSIKNKNCVFLCSDFDSEIVYRWIKISDFVYLDPPYLITSATYNETNNWNNYSEYKLLNLLDKMLSDGKIFSLSNMLEKTGKKNEPLYYWCQKHSDSIKCYGINNNYRSSSYNKINRNGSEKEVIITNVTNSK